jgi:epoxyqueuosine reductase
MKTEITRIIQKKVKDSPQHELYREAIVGFASAADPLYTTLRDALGRKMLTPRDILPSANTVVTFFIPFSEMLINHVRSGGKIVQIWSDAYTLTNPLLKQIADDVRKYLNDAGFESTAEPPTMNYDSVNLTAKWSHKSSAVIAGIGTFGLNRLVITKSGTAGRLNSVITSAVLEPDKRPETEYCLYKKNGTCGVCMERCPSGAINPDGFDRFRCNAYLDGKNISDFEQGCGMCGSGSCAVKGFV